MRTSSLKLFAGGDLRRKQTIRRNYFSEKGKKKKKDKHLIVTLFLYMAQQISSFIRNMPRNNLTLVIQKRAILFLKGREKGKGNKGKKGTTQASWGEKPTLPTLKF